MKKAPFNFRSPDGYEERSETFGVHKPKDKDTRFLHVLYHLVEQKIDMLRALDSELIQYDPDQVTRYNERESYKYIDIQDYLDTYNQKKEFIIQRVNTVLSDNLSFHQDGILDRDKIIEELSPQLIQSSKKTLYELLENDLKKKLFCFYPVFLADAMKYAKFSLFIPGYSTTLKQLYPDQAERTTIRQNYIQTIIKELVLELQERLISHETFSIQEYCMWQPLLYVYNRY